jgi:hypothetical protein
VHDCISISAQQCMPIVPLVLTFGVALALFTLGVAFFAGLFAGVFFAGVFLAAGAAAAAAGAVTTFGSCTTQTGSVWTLNA